MNNRQSALCLSTLLTFSTANAELLQFSNGDSLNVELIEQTDATLTFSHPALGQQVLDKTNISNLHELDLESLVRVSDKEIRAAEQEAQLAKENIKIAEQALEAAKQTLKMTQETVAVASADERNVIEQAVLKASEDVVLAEQKLQVARQEVQAAEEHIVVAENVKAAKTKVKLAKEKMAVAQEKIKLAKADVKALIDFEDMTDPSTQEDQLGIAEEQVISTKAELREARKNVKLAEEQVKIAKGEKVNDGFMGTGWFKDWDSSVELGLKGSSGASTNTTFRAAFNTRYEDDEHRWDFKSFYLFDSENNIAGENRVNAILVKDWFFPDTKWFAFASIAYDWDEFKDWQHRVQLSTGPGYQYIKTDDWEFSGRIGGTGIYEFNKATADASSPTGFTESNVLGFQAMAGVDLTWHITAKQRFSVSNYIYPGLTDPGEFRNLTTVAWVHDIDWFEGLALKFGIRNEYDTTESVKNEFKYNFSVLWGF